MDEPWKTILEQAPTVGALIWLVVYFLRHLEKVAQTHEERIARLDAEHVSRIYSITETTNRTIEKNTAAFEKVLEKLPS